MKLKDLGRVGIVGGGGGLRGISTVGFLRALIERGVHRQVNYLFGVSVSALVLSAFSKARDPEDWQDIWESVRTRFNIIEKRGAGAVFDFSFRRLVTGAESMVDNSRLSDLLKDLDPKECVTSPMHFEAAVLSRHYGRKIILSNHSNIFKKKPILFPKLPEGSSALTPFFAPVRLPINGEEDMLSDGISIFMGSAVKRCDTIFALFPYPKQYVARPVEQYGRLSPMHIPIVRNFVESYEIQHKVEDDLVLGCAVSHAKISGRPRIIPVYADTCPVSVGPLDFAKGDYPVACKMAEELMSRKLHTLEL